MEDNHLKRWETALDLEREYSNTMANLVTEINERIVNYAWNGDDWLSDELIEKYREMSKGLREVMIKIKVLNHEAWGGDYER